MSAPPAALIPTITVNVINLSAAAEHDIVDLEESATAIFRHAGLASGHNTGKLLAATPLPAGRVRVAVEFVPDANQVVQPTPNLPAQARLATGTAKLWINGALAGSAPIAGVGNSAESFDIGADLGSPVSSSYTCPFTFSGKVDTVTVDLRN